MDKKDVKKREEKTDITKIEKSNDFKEKSDESLHATFEDEEE